MESHPTLRPQANPNIINKSVMRSTMIAYHLKIGGHEKLFLTKSDIIPVICPWHLLTRKLHENSCFRYHFVPFDLIKTSLLIIILSIHATQIFRILFLIKTLRNTMPT